MSEGIFANLETRIKQLVGISVIFYALGYIARSSQLAMLGVTNPLPLADQTYLLAGLSFIAFTAYALVQSLPMLGIVCIPLALLSRLKRVRELLNRDRILVAAISLPLTAVTLFTRARVGQALALRAAALSPPAATNWIVSDLADSGNACWLQYVGLVMAAAVSASLLLAIMRRPAGPPELTLARVLTSLILAAQVVVLPAAYGVLAQGVSYPVIELIPKPASTGAKLALLLQTDKQLVVMDRSADPSDGRLRLLTLDRSDAKIVVTDRFINIFALIGGKSTLE